MLNKLALLSTLFLVACVDQPSDELFENPELEARFCSSQWADRITAELEELTNTTGGCPVVPDSAPCAALCDDDGEGLTPFIPPGTCVTFVCTGTDGGLVHAGGCRLPDENPTNIHPELTRSMDRDADLSNSVD